MTQDQQLAACDQLAAHIKRQVAETAVLQALWQLLLPGKPGSRQFSIWLDRHPFKIVEKGIRQCASKYNKREVEAAGDEALLMSYEECLRYASAVMIRVMEEQAP
jgi:hypothetical protein